MFQNYVDCYLTFQQRCILVNVHYAYDCFMPVILPPAPGIYIFLFSFQVSHLRLFLLSTLLFLLSFLLRFLYCLPFFLYCLLVCLCETWYFKISNFSNFLRLPYNESAFFPSCFILPVETIFLLMTPCCIIKCFLFCYHALWLITQCICLNLTFILYNEINGILYKSAYILRCMQTYVSI